MNYKVINSEEKEFNLNERTLVHWISTPDIDSYNEVLMPKGMDDSTFKAVLWSHSLGNNLIFDTVAKPSDIVIGKSLWRKATNEGVKAKTQFVNSELGNDIMEFNRLGLINSWSVGWLPKQEPEVRKDGVKVYHSWNLYEYSSVIIPANPNAVNIMFENSKSLQLKSILNFEIEKNNFQKQLDELKLIKKTIEEVYKELKNSNKKDEYEKEIGILKSELEKQIDINNKLKKLLIKQIKSGDISRR
jgi:hypothetical protein